MQPPFQILLCEASEDSDCVLVMVESSTATITVVGMVSAGDKKVCLSTC